MKDMVVERQGACLPSKLRGNYQSRYQALVVLEAQVQPLSLLEQRVYVFASSILGQDVVEKGQPRPVATNIKTRGSLGKGPKGSGVTRSLSGSSKVGMQQ